MRLKTLELQGFKSFPEKTVIKFERGITVVVGPNGSGKSNISDAMKWVLGELSSKSIRGTKMEDVIFSGSQRRSPMSYAEVTVTFDNTEEEGKILSMKEFDEISVTRRFTRKGQSEYFINKKDARLKDIVELFMNTGLGKGGYSIIGQGKIAEIISQKNEERRIVFEEAAGISKYKYQKNDAVKKLSETDINLTRLTDIEHELSVNVAKLEVEAEKARKYNELYNEKKAVDIALSVFGIEQAEELAEAASKKLAVSKLELERTDNAVKVLETRYNDTYASLQQNKMDAERVLYEINDKTTELHTRRTEAELSENDNRHYAEQARTTEVKLSSAREEAKKQEAVLSEKKNELDASEKERVSAASDVAALKEEEAECFSELRGAESQLNDAAGLIEETEKAINDGVLSVSLAQARMKSDAEKIKQLDESIASHQSDIEMLGERIGKADKKIKEYSEKEKEIQLQADKASAEADDADGKLKAEYEKKNGLFLDISQRKHKVQNLVRMEELLEGYSGAVRFITSECKAGNVKLANGMPVNVYGPLSKLITVDEKYTLALEIAFGQSLQNVVVGDDGDAKACIEYLKRKKAGRATFYPVSTMRARTVDRNDAGMKSMRGYIATADELVKCDSEFSGIIGNIVGRVIIAQDIDCAGAIAKYLSYRYRIVTLDGQTVNAGGSFTGGSAVVESGMLSRGAQIEKLNAEISVLEKQLAESDKTVEALKADKEKARSRYAERMSTVNVLRALSGAESTQMQVLQSNMDMTRSSLNSLSDEREGLSKRTERSGAEEKQLEQLKKENTEKLERLRAHLKRTQSEKDSIAERLDECRTRLANANIALARAEKSVEMARAIYDSERSKLDGRRAEIISMKDYISEMENKIAENERNASGIAAFIEEARKRIAELEEKKKTLTSEGLEIEQKLNMLREKQNETTGSYKNLYAVNADNEAEYSRMCEKKGTLSDFLAEEYSLTYSEACEMDFERATSANYGELSSRQTKLKNRIRAMGSVNTDSIDEYATQKERYDTLKGQITDLTNSREDLTRIISSLEDTMKEDFSRTVSEINLHFGKVFSELFGGGTAEVKLSDPSNVLESGIDINVAPPGKIINSLTLLSGGEQAFVAIALYFSILKVNPSPFCIMDEIESALDDINVNKFAEYVKRYCDRTQFVLISHRRGTMEAAERLYGVAMQEKGISEVLSIDVSEIESKIIKKANYIK